MIFKKFLALEFSRYRYKFKFIRNFNISVTYFNNLVKIQWTVFEEEKNEEKQLHG